MPTISTDCHITFTHADINSGNPYGFILQRANNQDDPPVLIQRKVTSSDTITITIYFTVLLADDLINPDGSQHSEDRAAMYAMLISYLGKTSGLTFSSPIGAIADVGASGHSATETHYAGYSTVGVQLTNAGLYYGAVDLTAFGLSVWDGTLFWNTSYWR